MAPISPNYEDSKKILNLLIILDRISTEKIISVRTLKDY